MDTLLDLAIAEVKSCQLWMIHTIIEVNEYRLIRYEEFLFEKRPDKKDKKDKF